MQSNAVQKGRKSASHFPRKVFRLAQNPQPTHSSPQSFRAKQRVYVTLGWKREVYQRGSGIAERVITKSLENSFLYSFKLHLIWFCKRQSKKFPSQVLRQNTLPEWNLYFWSFRFSACFDNTDVFFISRSPISKDPCLRLTSAVQINWLEHMKNIYMNNKKNKLCYGNRNATLLYFSVVIATEHVCVCFCHILNFFHVNLQFFVHNYSKLLKSLSCQNSKT